MVWIFCLVLLGIAGFEYWQIREVRGELDQTRVELNSARNLLSSVTGEISATGESLSEKDSAIRSELKTVNHEIRKLWDLANKRNKKDISAHDARLDKLENQAGKVGKEVSKATSEAKSVKSSVTDLEVSLQKLVSQQVADKSEMLAALDALKIRVSAIEKQAADQTKWQADVEKSVDNFRVQVNRKLLQVESSLRELKQPAEQGL